MLSRIRKPMADKDQGFTLIELLTVHKAATMVIAATLTLSVAACSGSSGPPPPSAKTTTSIVSKSPNQTATAAPTSAGETLHPTADNPLGINWSKQAPFTGAVADQFGADNIMNAYQEAVTFSLVQGYTNLMAEGYEAKPIEFSFVGPYLTTSAQHLWATQVLAALSNPKDVKAFANVFSLTTWNAVNGQDTYKFRNRQVLYTLGMDFSPAKTSLETVGANKYLVLQFTVSRNLRVMNGSKALLLPMKKDITYWMIPNGLKDRPWLITKWTITWAPGTTTPDPLGATS